MASAQATFPTVVRTSRGLTVNGTRLTLYTLMDCFKADWPPKLVQQVYKLSDVQMLDILGYLDAHREEIEAEYQEVLQNAAEIQQYWENRNRDKARQADESPKTPQHQAIRTKLQALRDKLGLRK